METIKTAADAAGIGQGRNGRGRPPACRAALALALLASQAAAQKAPPRDLTQLPLDELFNLTVTTVSKKEQPLVKAGAAAFVITADDIRRSGATNIPDLLRMAPGVEVAQIDANSWAISIRGFNSRYSNKVLVLIDGRSLYNPIFSGVLWDQIALPLEDVERIEVLRGPGGTVWGANAANGVINIITRTTSDTPGGTARSNGGPAGQEELLQYGGSAGKRVDFRIYGGRSATGNSIFGGGASASDGWRAWRAGFRSDAILSGRDSLMLEGNLFDNREGQTLTTLFSNDLAGGPRTFNDQVRASGGDVLGAWRHTLADGSEASAQFSHDEFRRYDQANIDVHTTDANLQYHFAWGSRQDLIAGVEFRNSGLGLRDGDATQLSAPTFHGNLWSSFVQDEIQLTGSLSLTLGSKFEHNSFTGFEFEPSAQLVWAPTAHQTAWLSAAQAVRQPEWVDVSARYDLSEVALGNGAFGVVQVTGNPHATAERVRDFEAGYRVQLSPGLALDTTAFLSFYHGLQTDEPAAAVFVATPAPPHVVLPEVFEYLAAYRDWGGEMLLTWNAASRWRLSPGFSYLRMNGSLDPSSQSFNTLTLPGDVPRYQAQLRSSLTLPHRLEWDAAAYFVSALTNGNVAAYTRLDTRLGWRAGESLEFSIAGQNLLSPGHYEFNNAYGVHLTEVRRSVIAKVIWRF